MGNMNTGTALALAGLAKGLQEGRENKRERERQKQEDAWTNEERTRRRKTWEKEDKTEADAEAAKKLEGWGRGKTGVSEDLDTKTGDRMLTGKTTIDPALIAATSGVGGLPVAALANLWKDNNVKTGEDVNINMGRSLKDKEAERAANLEMQKRKEMIPTEVERETALTKARQDATLEAERQRQKEGLGVYRPKASGGGSRGGSDPYGKMKASFDAEVKLLTDNGIPQEEALKIAIAKRKGKGFSGTGQGNSGSGKLDLANLPVEEFNEYMIAKKTAMTSAEEGGLGYDDKDASIYATRAVMARRADKAKAAEEERMKNMTPEEKQELLNQNPELARLGQVANATANAKNIQGFISNIAQVVPGKAGDYVRTALTPQMQMPANNGVAYDVGGAMNAIAGAGRALAKPFTRPIEEAERLRAEEERRKKLAILEDSTPLWAK